MNKQTCPKCHSSKIKFIDYLGAKCLVCSECGYDESDDLEASPSERKSQREKGRYSPYKAGGKGRSRK